VIPYRHSDEYQSITSHSSKDTKRTHIRGLYTSPTGGGVYVCVRVCVCMCVYVVTNR